MISVSFKPKREKPKSLNTYNCLSILGKMALSFTQNGELIELNLAWDQPFPRLPKDLEPLLKSIETHQWDALPPLIAFGTPFQIQVWEALAGLTPGTLTTYQQIAHTIGYTSGFQAVGQAVGANPLAWIIPCHRVLSSSGGLGGYRWGLNIKKSLLLKEGHKIHP